MIEFALTGSFPHLIDLDLGNNRLATIPTHLTSLHSLKLGNNRITTVPNQLSNLTRLDDLELDNNQISGDVSIAFAPFAAANSPWAAIAGQQPMSYRIQPCGQSMARRQVTRPEQLLVARFRGQSRSASAFHPFVADVSRVPKGFTANGDILRIPVTGRAGIPKDASAVAINLTATQSLTPG